MISMNPTRIQNILLFTISFSLLFLPYFKFKAHKAGILPALINHSIPRQAEKRKSVRRQEQPAACSIGERTCCGLFIVGETLSYG